jgi:surface polysaccharide O-acyltransferase-like enzyme
VNNRTLKRNPAVELIRIIGCMIVIGCHTCLSTTISGRWDNSRTFLAMVFADGVAVFWVIAGFYFFKNNSYVKVFKHAFKNIFIPMLLLGIFVFYLGDFVMRGASLKESITHSLSDYINVGKTFITWTNPFSDCGHTWYIYAYMLIILIFPILKCFADFLDEDVKREICFLIVSFAFLIVNDITKNTLAGFSHHSINAMIPAAIEILWGHILFRHKEYFTNRRFIPTSLIAFVVLNLFRTWIQLQRAEGENVDKSIMYWYSSIGLICALCIAIFCFSLIQNLDATRSNIFICKIASYTFPIYLIHIVIRNVLNNYGVQGKLQDALSGGNSILTECLYSISIILLIFIISLLMCMCLRGIKYIFLKLTHLSQ